MFTGAARYHGKSINDIIHSVPKLQRDIVDISGCSIGHSLNVFEN